MYVDEFGLLYRDEERHSDILNRCMLRVRGVHIGGHDCVRKSEMPFSWFLDEGFRPGRDTGVLFFCMGFCPHWAMQVEKGGFFSWVERGWSNDAVALWRFLWGFVFSQAGCCGKRGGEWDCSEAASLGCVDETGAGGGDYLLRRGGVCGLSSGVFIGLWGMGLLANGVGFLWWVFHWGRCRCRCTRVL